MTLDPDINLAKILDPYQYSMYLDLQHWLRRASQWSRNYFVQPESKIVLFSAPIKQFLPRLEIYLLYTGNIYRSVLGSVSDPH